MRKTLLSVGIDIGTSTTQLVISNLQVENRAGAFSVPRMAITRREVVYRSAIHFTPLLNARTVDGEGVRRIVAEEYRKAGVDRGAVETGAVIITGETARKENAEQVLKTLSEFAGDFVVSAAGPDLESVLAARGAGCDVLSEERRCSVLNFDIGGGTANLALFCKGELRAVGCYDIGGRLVRCGEKIDYVAPVLQGRFEGLSMGERTDRQVLEQAAEDMAQTLAQAAGFLPRDGRMEHYATAGAAPPRVFRPDLITFSGGVADCIWNPPEDWWAYGDMGVLLGRAIRKVFSSAGARLVRGAETIRATVVGAGSHATELSGSTVYHRGVDFPLKNLPVLKLDAGPYPETLAQTLREKLDWYADGEGTVQTALGMEGLQSPSYGEVAALADAIASGLSGRGEGEFFPVVVLEQDMAKVLGQALGQRLAGPVLCLDGVAIREGDYIDVGAPVGGAFPVVVKTLAFEKGV